MRRSVESTSGLTESTNWRSRSYDGQSIESGSEAAVCILVNREVVSWDRVKHVWVHVQACATVLVGKGAQEV